jgi:hypothetical protein
MAGEFFPPSPLTTATGITRAAIATYKPAVGINTIVTTGFATVGDLGAGASYSSVGATSSSAMAIQDANGTWWGLVINGPVNMGWFGAVDATGATDYTSAMQSALNAGDVFVPAGTFMIGGSNTQISIPSNRKLFGIKGRSFLKASSTFSTSGSDSTYYFLLYTSGNSNIKVDGLSFLLQATSGYAQSKMAFVNCSYVEVCDCYFQENSTWDLLFNNCSNFDVHNNRFECGVDGSSLGVGMRICNASTYWSVYKNDFYGSLVTKMQAGAGAQPSGDKWGAVGLNIDCSTQNSVNSNQFKGGSYQFTTDGTGNPVVITIPGVVPGTWRAWVDQPYSTSMGASIGTSLRTAIATITNNTITISALPGGPPLNYRVQYAFFGATPSDGQIYENTFNGFAYSGTSIINGMQIKTENNRYSHIGDVAYDPEGCLNMAAINNFFNDCNCAGLCMGYGSRFDNNTIIDSGTPISIDADSGAAYQAFGPYGLDYGNNQYQTGSITVAAPSGSTQAISGSSGAFTMINVNDWLRINISGTLYEYNVISKTDNQNIGVNNTLVRIFNTPRVSASTLVIPNGVYSASTWTKSPFMEALFGLQGACTVNDNLIYYQNVAIGNGPAIYGTYVIGMDIQGNKIHNRYIAINITNGRSISISGGRIAGMIYFQYTSGLSISGVLLSESGQRGIILDTVYSFLISGILSVWNIDGNTGSPAIIYANCINGRIETCMLSEVMGDSVNLQPTIQQGLFSYTGNSINTSITNNTNVNITNVDKYKSGLAITQGLAPPTIQQVYNPPNTSTSASTVLSAANIFGGSAECTLNMTGAITLASNAQLPLVTALVTAIGNAVIGQTYKLRVINSGGSVAGVWTLIQASDSSWTLNGAMTVAVGAYTDFYVTLTSLTAAVLQRIGSGTL